MFVLIGCARRRPAGTFAWRPHAQDQPARGGRWLALLAAAGLCVFPLAMYLSPQGFWDAVTLGKGVPGGLQLTDGFLDSCSAWPRSAG